MMHYTREPRSQTEREADLFAAEFLMPEKQLVPIFRTLFGKQVVASPRDASLVYKLSVGTGRSRYDVERLLCDSMGAATLIAAATSFGVRQFESLAARFAVSPIAMAIQLLDLGLVSSPVAARTMTAIGR